MYIQCTLNIHSIYYIISKLKNHTCNIMVKYSLLIERAKYVRYFVFLSPKTAKNSISNKINIFEIEFFCLVSIFKLRQKFITKKAKIFKGTENECMHMHGMLRHLMPPFQCMRLIWLEPA